MTAVRRAFGQAVRHFRSEAGLTQAELAAAVQISTGYVGLIETGARGAKPSPDLTRRLAVALKLGPIKTEDLFRAGGHLRPNESLYADRSSTAVIDAIQSDAKLSEQSKRLMINVYTSIRRPKGRRSVRESTANPP